MKDLRNRSDENLSCDGKRSSFGRKLKSWEPRKISRKGKRLGEGGSKRLWGREDSRKILGRAFNAASSRLAPRTHNAVDRHSSKSRSSSGTVPETGEQVKKKRKK